jgi:hypothetical protein
MSEVTNATELRKIATAARPAIQQWLEAAEELAAFSDLCRAKGLEWSQVKALLKAEHQDAQDGGQRVEKIRKKADRASDYAMILSGAPPKNISGEHQSSRGGTVAERTTSQSEPRVESQELRPGPRDSIDAGDIPEFLRREKASA